jgi:hypothetical protein
MTNTTPLLIFPMAFYVLYLFFMFLYVFFTRFASVKSGKTPGRYYKAYSNKEGVPERMLVLERHVDNQFQVPMVFLVTCTTIIASSGETQLQFVFAWIFVISRLAHSYIHLGRNHVLKRAGVYSIGWLVIVAMWLNLLITSIQ